MLNKNEIKDIQSLGLKKHRDETGLFVAEGPKIVKELLQLLPGQVEKVYGLPGWQEESREMLGDLPFQAINEKELERISQLQTPNRVLAVLRKLPVQPPTGEGFVLYLDSIQDPGNFGTIVRIADWFGIDQVVAAVPSADLYNPKVVQSTMASIARVKVFYDEGGNWIRQSKLPIYAAALDGGSLYETPKASSGVLLIGNESKGIRPELMELAAQRITIPRRGEAESLNAAVATGIILSHLLQ